MAGMKGKSGGARANSGGARPGAGRPKKERPPTARVYADALDYLGAVVCGTEEPDAVRVAAAKALLPFQAPRKRAPVKSPPPAQLQRSEALAADEKARADWLAKAAAIRARHGRSED